MSGNVSRERLVELSTLVGGLAHEIKNPLSTMKITLQLMRESWAEKGTTDAGRSVKKLDMLLGETHRLESMLQEFLRLATPSMPDFQPEDLNSIIEDLVEFMSPEFRSVNVMATSQLDSSIPMLGLDRNLIRQALLNIFKNSTHAMNDHGGTLTIQTRSEDADVVIDIIDTGPGMSGETLTQAFDFYYSTKTDGTGLGLPMVRRIIKQHSGHIECNSELGTGTKFTISIPKQAARE